jgi:hypothetical protein
VKRDIKLSTHLSLISRCGKCFAKVWCGRKCFADNKEDHKRFCHADTPQRKRKVCGEERLQLKTAIKEKLTENFEIMLQEADRQNCLIGNSRKSEIDFARQQIARNYVRESISEVD